MPYNPYRRRITWLDGGNPMHYATGLDWDDLRANIAEFIECEASSIGIDEGTEEDGELECAEFITRDGVRVGIVA